VNTQPDTVSLTDEERKILAAYLGVRGMVTRKDVKQLTRDFWDITLEHARKKAAKVARARSAPRTRKAATRKKTARKPAARKPAKRRTRKKNPTEEERWG